MLSENECFCAVFVGSLRRRVKTCKQRTHFGDTQLRNAREIGVHLARDISDETKKTTAKRTRATHGESTTHGKYVEIDQRIAKKAHGGKYSGIETVPRLK